MATTTQRIPDIYHIFAKENDNHCQKHIAFSNSDRIKNWLREKLTNPQGIAKNPLSQNIKTQCKERCVNRVISMCGASALIVLHINTSYLLKMVASVTSIASIFLYNTIYQN